MEVPLQKVRQKLMLRRSNVCLFVLVVEVAFILTNKANYKIDSFTIFGQNYLYTPYSDDVTFFFLKSLNSIRGLKDVC